MKLYRPSNGSEGLWFNNEFCCACKKGGDDGVSCEIYNRTLWLGIDNPDYPQEWQQDENGPTCTAYEEE